MIDTPITSEPDVTLPALLITSTLSLSKTRGDTPSMAKAKAFTALLNNLDGGRVDLWTDKT